MILNLVTKQKFYNKPTKEGVEKALVKLREYLEECNINAFCMPQLACGLDKLSLNALLEMLPRVFKDMDLKIYMYHFQPSEAQMKWKTCVTECSLCTLEDRAQIQPTLDEVTLNWTTIVPEGVPQIQLAKDQRLDEDIMPIFIAVEEEKKPQLDEVVHFGPKTRALWHQFNSLVVNGQLLWRRIEHVSGDPSKEKLQLILPRKHMAKTVQLYHSQLGAANHFGVFKTISYLKRFFGGLVCRKM